MISINNLSVIFGDRRLFDNMSFAITQKDKIGLVGKNGAGKSTLLKTIVGEQLPTKGSVAIPKEYRIGYLPQQMKHNEGSSVIDEALSAFSEINELQDQIDEITRQLETRDDYQSESYSKLIEDLTLFNDRLNVLGAENTSEQTEKILKGLGFKDEDMQRSMSEFSGGWKMRVELAKILLQAPDLLLLDEPTNHLDIDSIEWLEQFLVDSTSSIMLISHDRDFLDNVTNRTIEISKGNIYDYRFSYSKYLVQRRDEIEKQEQAYKNQQKYIADTEKLINKFRAKKNKAAFAQTLIKKLDKLERIEIDDFEKTKINIKFPPAPHSGKIVVKAENLSKRFGDNEIFSNVDFIVPKGERLAIVGKNGAGKTTFLRILNKELDHDGHVELGHQVKMGYFAQDEADKLDENKTVFEIIDDEAVGEIRTQIRGLLGAFLFSGTDIDKKVKVLSGGERTRLALCRMMLQPVNLLVLDEPTNHLDLKSKEVLKQALNMYDGTLIVVSHDRNFLHGLVNNIYEVQKHNLKHFIGDIYEFLKEKRAESIAQFEKKSVDKKEVKKEVSENKLSYEEKKDLERRKRKLKNKISRCESEILEKEEILKEMDSTISNLDYSDQEKANNILEEYANVKKNIDQLMLDWEEAEDELKNINI